jgi:hypothetical protein
MIGWTCETKEIASLALAKFPDLRESELKMICGATIGEVAYCGPSRKDDDPGNDPAREQVGSVAHHSAGRSSLAMH